MRLRRPRNFFLFGFLSAFLIYIYIFHCIPYLFPPPSTPLLFSCTVLFFLRLLPLLEGGDGGGRNSVVDMVLRTPVVKRLVDWTRLSLSLCVGAYACVLLFRFFFAFAWPLYLIGLPCHFPSRPPFLPIFFALPTRRRLHTSLCWLVCLCGDFALSCSLSLSLSSSPRYTGALAAPLQLPSPFLRLLPSTSTWVCSRIHLSTRSVRQLGTRCLLSFRLLL